MTNLVASFPTAIKYKFYEGGELSKFDCQTLSCRGYQGKEWGKLGKKIQEKIYDWKKELNYNPGTGRKKGINNSERDKKIKDLKR